MENRFRFVEPPVQESLLATLGKRAIPLRTTNDLDPLMRHIGDARYVLLGEASHGTHEFYVWRAAITRRLIVERGFSFVAVEGDWPDFERVDDFVKHTGDGQKTAKKELLDFHRWPTWMWANTEVAAFMEWLRDHNSHVAENNRVGMHGLDIYSLWESMDAVVRYLDGVDPQAAKRARHLYECFAPYDRDGQDYARSTALFSTSCEDEVIGVLTDLKKHRVDRKGRYFLAEQNALTAMNAEAYYRAMIQRGPLSWNLRDEHMVSTLDRLTELYGPESKVIVWAHNTHVGDARYTDMAAGGQINVGQLVRERHSKEGVVLVGFATSAGTVMAGERWGSPARVMKLPTAQKGSIEDVLERVGLSKALYLFNSDESDYPLVIPRALRAIGVVYDPKVERYGNYVPMVLPRAYDALVYLHTTRALHALDNVTRREPDLPETYPSAL